MIDLFRFSNSTVWPTLKGDVSTKQCSSVENISALDGIIICCASLVWKIPKIQPTAIFKEAMLVVLCLFKGSSTDIIIPKSSAFSFVI